MYHHHVRTNEAAFSTEGQFTFRTIKDKQEVYAGNGNKHFGLNNSSWYIKPDFVSLLTEKFDDDALAEARISEGQGAEGYGQEVVGLLSVGESSELEESDNDLVVEKPEDQMQNRERSK